MAVVQYNDRQLDLLAKLMRAEAEGEGNLGMLMVGNVGVNRVRVDCLDFKNIRNLEEMVFQRPGGFEATQKPYFFQPARESDRRLTLRVVNGERFHPAQRSLWFFEPAGDCPAQWYNQWNSGRFKSHCFFSPSTSDCPNI